MPASSQDAGVVLSADNDGLSVTHKEYLPSSVERKKVIMMYVLVGIFIVFFDHEVSVYEQYHVKQSLGWWMIAMLFIVISLALMWLPIIRILLFLCGLLLLGIRGWMVRQAWKGAYLSDEIKKKHTSGQRKSFFELLGNRVLEVFEISLHLKV